MREKISIVIPILNEEKNIYPLTNRIIKYLKKNKFEIIFVDDSSEDNSKKILKKLEKNYNFFNPIFRKRERDLCRSCFSGIEKSKFDNVLIMDGDLQHDPKYIPSMIKKIENKNVDIVIGARKLHKPNNRGLTEVRRFASVILIFFFSIFDIRTADPMSGFFLFKKKIYKKNKQNFFGRGFKILVDFLINSKPKPKTIDVYIDFKRRFHNSSKMNYKILLILIQFYIVNLFKKLFI